MTPLSDALTAAQRRALSALEKAYVAGHVSEDDLRNALTACGITDPVETDYLLRSLDVLQEWGASLPAETNGKPDPATEKMSDKQRGFLEQLCRERNLPPPDALETLTKAEASDAINALQAGNYDPAKWRVPF